MQRLNRKAGDLGLEGGSIPFPKAAQRTKAVKSNDVFEGEEVLAAFADVSRRIDNLARELKCLGYFDDDSDRPRAA